MYNYKLVIEYDGRNYNGWQKQKYTKNTIQEYLESAISKILKEEIKLNAAGRTDSGVSAKNQVANFKYLGKINFNRFIYSLNSILPVTITVKKISSVPLEFHSRYSAKKREYLYNVTTKKRAISHDYYYQINYEIDFLKIDSFIEFILLQRMFRSFCKNKNDKHNFSCIIYDFGYKQIKSKNEIVFKISANRFLHSMVRAIIGCALDIGRQKIILNSIKEKVKKGDKIQIKYLPANALFLNKIYY